MHHSKGEASLCARGVCVARIQEVPADALGDARRGGVHRVPRQMSVGGRLVCTWVCPRSFPIMVRLSPRASARDAKEWRRS